MIMIIVKHSISNSVFMYSMAHFQQFLIPTSLHYTLHCTILVIVFKNPFNIFRMNKTISIYNVRHSKEVSAFLAQLKQLYNPDSCIIEITMNKTKGHHTPFMVQLPHLNPLIVNQYPGMTQGPNNGMFYIPSSASKNQDASYNLRKSRLDWELYAVKPRFRLIKEVVSK